MKIKKNLTLNGSHQAIANIYRAYAGGRTCINKVPGFQCNETGNILNDIIKRKDHIPGIPILNIIAVEFKLKLDSIPVGQGIQRNKFVDNCRLVKCFGYFPRVTVLFTYIL